MRRPLMLLVLAGAACGPSGPPAADDVEHAYQRVWEGVYGMPKSARPPVTWHVEVECYDEYGNSGIRPASGGCYLGWATPLGVDVLYLGELGPTAFAHELYHVAYYDQQPSWLKSVNSMDAQHKTEGWSTLVPIAESTLR